MEPPHTPPPLPAVDQKSSRRVWLIVLACVGGFLVLSVPVALAILIPTVGKVRQQAQRVADSTDLRQIVQASLIRATEYDGALPPVGLAADGTVAPSMPATVHAVAAALARDGGLNEASIWLSGAERHRAANDAARVLGADRTTVDPTFARQTAVAWDYATGLNVNLSPTTPVAWTRGLREDGRWDPATGVYGSDGGYIAFLGGNVIFFSDLAGGKLVRPDGARTQNILEALPSSARVVGAGSGTLHGRTGRAR